MTEREIFSRSTVIKYGMLYNILIDPLTLDLGLFSSQGQGQTRFDYEYLVNGDRKSNIATASNRNDYTALRFEYLCLTYARYKSNGHAQFRL